MQNVNFHLTIVDDNSDKNIIEKMYLLLNKQDFVYNFINLSKNTHNNTISTDDKPETISNLSSLLKCFQIAKNEANDLIFFVEDDYLHKSSMLEEMLMSYERFASQLNDEIVLCPSDYPYLYTTGKKTNIFIGSHRHWQMIDKTLCTFLTSKDILNQYWENFINTCKKRNDPFEKYLNEIYQKVYCFSPIKSLSVHCANVNSSYGIAPYINVKKLWDQNAV